jgi:hypothetical protein
MNGLLILACVSGFTLLCGLASFSLMFSDHTPSQNSYAWPYLIPVGLMGLLLAGAGALVRWMA